jgi:hypothetical protein
LEPRRLIANFWLKEANEDVLLVYQLVKVMVTAFDDNHYEQVEQLLE